MSNTYSGKVQEKDNNIQEKFNWVGLIIWLISLIISLIPTGLSMLSYFNKYHKIDQIFWLNCFVGDDILWIFATLVLFSMMNHILRLKKKENISICLLGLGLLIFAVTEGFWLFCKFVLKTAENMVWPINIGVILIIISFIIATPLQIEFRRKRGDK